MSRSSTSNGSSLPSEDEGEISLETQARFSEALDKIQRRDASIYDKDVRFFETTSSSESEGEDEGHEAPLYLKDVRARQLLEYGPEAYASDEEIDDTEEIEEDHRNLTEKRKRLLYDKSQIKNKDQLLIALASDTDSVDDDFGGLQKLEQSKESIPDTPDKTESKETKQKCLDAYFSRVADLKKEDAAFLKEYIEKEEWRVDKWGMDETEDDVNFEEDEAYLEQGAKFEADYNHRFEEPGSHVVIGHPRLVEGSLRTQESKRKRQRKNKALRKHQQKLKDEHEIKEQKNIKRKAIQQKLMELREVSGKDIDENLLEKLLDSDHEFDVNEWNAEMEDVFDDDYYQKEDAEFPLNAEDIPLEHIPATECKFEMEDVEKEETFQMDDVEKKQELQKLMQEYYTLDREDTIDGVKCRYRYIKMPKDNFGLEPHDVLCLDDKQLNSYVGLRRLNPYRNDLMDYKPHPWKLKQLLSEVDYSGLSKGHPSTSNQSIDPQLPVLDNEESELAEKIRQEHDVNVQARLASYSHETLKPYQTKKRSRTSIIPMRPHPTEGMKKSQKKNMKRKMLRQQKAHGHSMTKSRDATKHST